MEKQLDPIVTKLISLQKAHDMSDAAFAARLNVSRQLWAMTRVGATPVGLSVLAGVLTEFPGLRDEVITAISNYRDARHPVAAKVS